MFKIGDIVEFICGDNEGCHGTKKGNLYKVISKGFPSGGSDMHEFEDLTNGRRLMFWAYRARLNKQKNRKPSWL